MSRQGLVFILVSGTAVGIEKSTNVCRIEQAKEEGYESSGSSRGSEQRFIKRLLNGSRMEHRSKVVSRVGGLDDVQGIAEWSGGCYGGPEAFCAQCQSLP